MDGLGFAQAVLPPAQNMSLPASPLELPFSVGSVIPRPPDSSATMPSFIDWLESPDLEMLDTPSNDHLDTGLSNTSGLNDDPQQLAASTVNGTPNLKKIITDRFLTTNTDVEDFKRRIITRFPYPSH